MVLEVAILNVRTGQEADFEQAFRTARAIITASPAYANWKALLHHFYDPFPTVEHYVEVLQ